METKGKKLWGRLLKAASLGQPITTQYRATYKALKKLQHISHYSAVKKVTIQLKVKDATNNKQINT